MIDPAAIAPICAAVVVCVAIVCATVMVCRKFRSLDLAIPGLRLRINKKDGE